MQSAEMNPSAADSDDTIHRERYQRLEGDIAALISLVHLLLSNATSLKVLDINMPMISYPLILRRFASRISCSQYTLAATGCWIY